MSRSDEILKRPESSFNRSLYKAMGYSDDDLTKPIIGIANSWSTLVPGHFNLDKISDYVKRGIYRGGGTAVEFGVIGSCDGLSQGNVGGNYILPSREVIANSVEIMAQANQLDGLVLLGSCDKIVPGMLMAAARIDIPALLIPAGPMLGGIEFDGRKSDVTSISEALGMLKAGNISEDEYYALEELSCPSCGSCSFLGTANTMCSISEALGMTLTGGALIPAVHPDRLRLALKTGESICNLVKDKITARDIINKKSLENAVKVTLGISGSTNTVIHLTAIAHEAEANIDVMNAFDRYSKDTPQVARVNPAAKWDMEAFWQAGGIPKVMESLKPILNLDVITGSGKTLRKNIKEYKYRFPENKKIIKDFDEPFNETGGLAVLRGNLAPETAVSKPGAIDPSQWHFKGRAKVFNSEEEAEKAILNNQIEAGDIVVIRYEGPKGGPGMREMFKAMKYIYGMGLAKETALITDGRFSGTNNGCFVGHISPEAAEGGPLAIVEDGDQITIDIKKGILNLHIPDQEIEKRFKSWTAPKPKIDKGYLSIYSKLAASAADGAILK